MLNTYMVQDQNGTVTQLTLPKNPVLTFDPPIGTPGATQRTTTLVLEFPRANFTSNDVLIYDPLVSYSNIQEESSEEADTTTSDNGTTGATTTNEQVNHAGKTYYVQLGSLCVLMSLCFRPLVMCVVT